MNISALPVYSRWNPAAETLISDWKFRYRLFDVLLRSGGMVVPEKRNQDIVEIDVCVCIKRKKEKKRKAGREARRWGWGWERGHITNSTIFCHHGCYQISVPIKVLLHFQCTTISETSTVATQGSKV